MSHWARIGSRVSGSRVSVNDARVRPRVDEPSTGSRKPQPTACSAEQRAIHPTSSLARRAPGPSTSSVPKQRFICPLGGIEEAIELQRAADHGHQPWRTSPTDVASACTFPGGVVKALGASTYQVTKVSTGQKVIVKEVQPVRPGPTGIWVVTNPPLTRSQLSVLGRGLDH
jgi:hypothetical protein